MAGRIGILLYSYKLAQPTFLWVEVFFFFLRHTDKASWGNLHKRILVEFAIHALGLLSGLKFLSDLKIFVVLTVTIWKIIADKILIFHVQFLSYAEEQSMRLQTIVVRVARVSTLPPSPGMPLQVRVLILNTSTTGNEPNTGQK